MGGWLHGLGGLASGGYREDMRTLLPLFLLLVACSKESADAPVGNEQAVIDKAEADVAAAEAEVGKAPE
jgi:hypothetical protein